MDYKNIYIRLIERAQPRILEGYIERHHIIPKCIGGTDDPTNLVCLTPEEHYLAHQLLVKMYPSEDKLIYAANMMTAGTKRNNKQYGWLKRRWVAMLTGRIVSDETKQKLSKQAKKRIQTKGHPRGFSGRKHTTEVRERMSIARQGTKNGMYGKHHTKEALTKMAVPKSEDHKRKISESKQGQKHPNYGKQHSDETRRKIAEGIRNSESVKCPHCGRVGKISPMNRWHFDKCRVKR